MHEKILIREIFGPTIQGEGALAGRATVFVRTGGCDFQCSWCDTPHAVKREHKGLWQPMSADQVFARVEELSGAAPLLVTISGGNPALQPLAPLLRLGAERGYTFAMETQGSIVKPWFAGLDHLILSPKPPSSMMEFRETRLKDCIDAARVRSYKADGSPGPQLSLKVVVMTENDYFFAKRVCERFARPYRIPFYITPGNHTPPAGMQYNRNDDEFDLEGVMARTRWLVERIRRDRWYDVSIIPQIHTLVWRNQQGV